MIQKISAFLRQHSKQIDILVVVFVAFVFMCWSFRITADLTNILAGPDEGMRYVLPNFIYEHGRLPTGYETQVQGNWSYAFYPQLLGALMSAGFMKITSIFTQDIFWLVHAARLTSLLFGVVAALFVRRSLRVLLEGHKHQALVGNVGMVLFALLPQVTFLSSYVNNDIIALAGVSMITYACLYIYKKEVSIASMVWFAVGATCAILGYLNSYGFVLAGAAYVLIRILQQHKQAKNTKRTALFLSIAAGIPLLLCLPFFIRNMVLYSGDFLGMATFRAAYNKWVAETGLVLQNPYKPGIFNLLFHTVWVLDTIKSFILGYFGGWSKGVAQVQYWPYYVILVGGISGFLLRLRRSQKSTQRTLLTWLMSFAVLVTVGLNFYYTLMVDYQPQGRYIIYLAVPLMIAVTLGCYYVVEKIVKTAYIAPVLVGLSGLYILLHLSIVYQTLF